MMLASDGLAIHSRINRRPSDSVLSDVDLSRHVFACINAVRGEECNRYRVSLEIVV